MRNTFYKFDQKLELAIQQREEEYENLKNNYEFIKSAYE